MEAAALCRAAVQAAVAVALLAAATPAQAAPVVAPPYPAGVAVVTDGGADPTLSYRSGTSDHNTVTISLTDGNYLVTDSSPVAAGADCIQVDPNNVSCPASGIADIRANGGPGNDVITVTASTSAVLLGREGDDTLTGGGGNDVLDGYLGNDVLNGGDGIDTADYSSVPGAVQVNLGIVGAPQPTGGAGQDTLSFLENLRGGAGNDTLIGDSASNMISGLGGSDSINSRDSAADVVSCGGGIDATVIADTLDLIDSSCEAADNGVPPETTITIAPPAFTNATTASFSFSSSEPTGATFQCSLDEGPFEPCDSGTKEYTEPPLPDGLHRFDVIAVDNFGNADQTPATHEWIVDTIAPDTVITAPAEGSTHGSSVTFEFSSPDADVASFECNLDASNWVECSSPLVASNLGEGAHTMAVRAVDRAGNRDPQEATRGFTVALPPVQPSGGGGGGASPGVTISRPLPSSLVLIAGRTVKISRTGWATVTLNCSGTKDCAGRVILTSAEPIRYSRLRRRKIVRLGSAKFTILAGRTRKVRIHLSRSKVKIVRKLRRLPADVTVRDLDRAGRARVSTRTIVLKALR